MNRKSLNLRALEWNGLVWQSLISTFEVDDYINLIDFGITSNLSGFEHFSIYKERSIFFREINLQDLQLNLKYW